MQISSLSVFLCSLVLLGATVHTFVVVPTTVPSKTTTLLFATNKKKKKNSAKTSSGGFGGASMEPCPCGSSETYSRCCGKLHKDVNAYKTATAEQVARARYAAFAKKQPDFLMASTHPLHKDFNTDLKKWKESIKQNMYDNFDLPRCVVVEENIDPSDDSKAEVKFVATMILKETGELTAFMETSKFERAKTHGGWLYLNGTIDAAPEEFVPNNYVHEQDESDGDEEAE